MKTVLFAMQVEHMFDLLLCLPLQVMNGAILQQVFVVEFVIMSQMCDDCHRVEAKDFWKAVVQVRQKVWYFKNVLSPCFALPKLNSKLSPFFKYS